MYPSIEESNSIILSDNNGNDMYGYQIENNSASTRFLKYFNIDGNSYNTLYIPTILPEFDTPLSVEEVNYINSTPQIAERYIAGQISLGSNLFSKMDNITIASSQHLPTIIEPGCLAKGHHYNFVLPENMDVIEVVKINKLRPKVFPRRYLMLADRRICLNYVDDLGYNTSIKHYEPKQLDKAPIITVDREHICENGTIIKREQNEIQM